ncbi:uncharacterized protein LOC127461454 [Manacus candei]|uniref:uncharacterized protein LOC127461454 n=1 Tax=Manacus candei TaxID=415023 RepID=UPI0022264A2C|nr:uncharacterized protein LOC127461454 [Manacus candei]
MPSTGCCPGPWSRCSLSKLHPSDPAGISLSTHKSSFSRCWIHGRPRAMRGAGSRGPRAPGDGRREIPCGFFLHWETRKGEPPSSPSLVPALGAAPGPPLDLFQQLHILILGSQIWRQLCSCLCSPGRKNSRNSPQGIPENAQGQVGATWDGGKCPARGTGGTGWALRSLPTQPTLGCGDASAPGLRQSLGRSSWALVGLLVGLHGKTRRRNPESGDSRSKAPFLWDTLSVAQPSQKMDLILKDDRKNGVCPGKSNFSMPPSYLETPRRVALKRNTRHVGLRQEGKGKVGAQGIPGQEQGDAGSHSQPGITPSSGSVAPTWERSGSCWKEALDVLPPWHCWVLGVSPPPC